MYDDRTSLTNSNSSRDPLGNKPIDLRQGGDEICDEEGDILTEESIFQRPILSLHEIDHVTSLDELADLYLQKGFKIDSRDNLLDRIRDDWGKHMQLEEEAALSKPLPADYPVHITVIEDRKYVLVGMLHNELACPEVLELLRDKLRETDFYLREQNLGTMKLGIDSVGLDIPDHSIYGSFYAWWISERVAWRGSWKSLRELMADPHAQQTVIASRAYLHLHSDISQSLPSHIELMYKHEKGLPYDEVQARSAYQAEFLRAWEPKLTFASDRRVLGEETFEKVTSEKWINIGWRHQPEIDFFLRNGVQDPKLIERARHDAGILNEDIDKFRKYCWGLRCQAYSFRAALYIGGGYILGHLVSLL